MKSELTVLLHRRFYSLHGHSDFSCGDGWYRVIDALFCVLEARERAEGLHLMVSDVKEKHGALSVQLHGGDDYCLGALDAANYMSSTLCELCGMPGKLNDATDSR